MLYIVTWQCAGIPFLLDLIDLFGLEAFTYPGFEKHSPVRVWSSIHLCWFGEAFTCVGLEKHSPVWVWRSIHLSGFGETLLFRDQISGRQANHMWNLSKFILEVYNMLKSNVRRKSQNILNQSKRCMKKI